MTSSQRVLDEVVSELVSLHSAHTVILYGSRANGTHSADSDFDIAAFAPAASGLRIARKLEEGYLDAFVYPSSTLTAPGQEHFKLLGGRLLLDRLGFAADFLRKLEEIHRLGPEALAPDEIQMRVTWAHKMVARATRGDPEGNFRRAWLLTALIEDYFAIHRRWYEGPKKSLSWLQANQPQLYDAYVSALRPDAPIAKLRELVEVAYGPLPS